MLLMQYSGYKEKIRSEVLDSALKAYSRIEKAVRDGKRPRYRGKNWQKTERAINKREKKKNWFKNGRVEEEAYKSVLFVQPTPGSKLRKAYEEEIKQSKCKIKVVERAGNKIKDKLQHSYPFEKQTSGKLDCFICATGGKGNCRRENVTYEIVCQEEGCGRKYVGETARTAHERGKEHLAAYMKGEEHSALFKHKEEHEAKKEGTRHKNDKFGAFMMNTTGHYDSALARQISEAIKIEMAPEPLNTRREFRHNSVVQPTFIRM